MQKSRTGSGGGGQDVGRPEVRAEVGIRVLCMAG